MLIFGGLFLFWLFFARTPHKAYTESNGTLIPIIPQGQFQYPQQNMNYQQPYPGGGMQTYQPPGMQQSYSQAHQPYGQSQPFSPYASPNYYPENPPVSQGNKYGSQYPQSQYLQSNNDYSTNFSSQSSQPYQKYQTQPEGSQHSRYTVDHPQTFQPYPDSHYATKPMQSNYRSDFKA